MIAWASHSKVRGLLSYDQTDTDANQTRYSIKDKQGKSETRTV